MNSSNNNKQDKVLIAGKDYPQTYREFVTMFPDNQSCTDFLYKLRWKDGFTCPECGALSEPWHQTHQRLVCPYCRHQTTVTTGTIFERTRTPLTTWLEAAWHVTTAKNGMSATTIERTLGISYRVAWTMLQRFRVAMVRSEREKLSGIVEVDETLIGSVDEGGKRGRGSKKSIVVIAIELHEPKGFGRIRMRFIPDASGENLTDFITVASLLKRWILGTHQGAFATYHLQAYLEEFTFRFNRRLSKHRGLVFRRLLEQAVSTPPVTEKNVTYGYKWNKEELAD